MQYSQDIIDKVQDFASIYLPISKMAVLLDIPAETLRDDIHNKTTPISKAYYKGKAESMAKLLRQEMELALVSSPQAIENTHRNLLDMEDDE